jgi:hypothetical protein
MKPVFIARNIFPEAEGVFRTQGMAFHYHASPAVNEGLPTLQKRTALVFLPFCFGV